MKGLTKNVSILLIILMFCLAPLSAVDNVGTVRFSGNNHSPELAPLHLDVGSVGPALGITVDNSSGVEKVTAEITAKKSFTGNVSVYLKGDLVPHEVLVKNGYGKTTFNNLTAGNCTASVTFGGDDYYASDVASTSFTVNKQEPGLKIDVNNVSCIDNISVDISGKKSLFGSVNIGHNVIVDINAKKSFTGNVSLYINNNPIPEKVLVKNGYAKASLGVLEHGEHVVTVDYKGDNKFSKSHVSTSFNVGKDNPTLKIHI